MKKLAPYGNYLANHKIGTAIIFMGIDGKERAEQFQQHLPYTLYLPHQTSPRNYYWPVKNCDVYLCDTERSRDSFIKLCGTLLLGYGANVVTYISSSYLCVMEKGT